VVIELAGDAQFARDLAVGGVFVPGCTLKLTEECDLMVCGANHQLSLPARVVYVEDQRGAGLELIGFSNDMKARLAELEPVASGDQIVFDEPPSDDSLSDAQLSLAQLAEYDFMMNGPIESESVIDLEALDAESDGDGAGDGDGVGVDPALPIAEDDRRTAVFNTAATLPPVEADTLPPEAALGHGDGGEGHDDDTYGTGEPGDGESRLPRNAHERLRGLALAAQIKMASSGELHERIMLERLYGKNVWETLLRNPRLTAPEVARIARYGSLPRVLLELIVANNAWLQIPEVRRALLSNPRLATDQIIKVLRVTPKPELKIAAIQTAYPHAVRNAAKMLLRE
jgi:hypothetical protein